MNIRKTFPLPLRHLIVIVSFIASFHTIALAQIPMHSPDKNQALLNEPVDISGDFRNFSNTYYVADSLSAFDPKTGKGEITYRRYQYFTRQAFNNMLAVLRPVCANEFPDREYAASPALPFSLEFISPSTVRIKTSSRFQVKPDQESLMLVNGKAPQDNSAWQYSKIDHGHRYTSPYGSVTITESPWRIEIRDEKENCLHTPFISRMVRKRSHHCCLSLLFVVHPIILRAWQLCFLCRLMKKYLAVASRLRNLIKEVRKLCCGRTMPTAYKTKRCISPFHFS